MVPGVETGFAELETTLEAGVTGLSFTGLETGFSFTTGVVRPVLEISVIFLGVLTGEADFSLSKVRPACFTR